MTTAMEFHDSRLLELVCNPDSTGHALFHAYIYRSEGVVFEDAQESGWQNLRLLFEGMRIEGERVEMGEYAAEGAMSVSGEKHEYVILLPANHAGEIQVDLVLSPLFDRLEIHASKVTSQLEGEWQPEAMWDDDGTFHSI